MSTRMERKKRARHRYACPAGCGGRGPHYVPPSFGDPGFFLCAQHIVDGQVVLRDTALTPPKPEDESPE